MTFQKTELIKEIVKYGPYYLQSIIMNEFMKECELKLFFVPSYLHELENIINEIAPEEKNKFLHFLLEIGTYASPNLKENILTYVIEKYPDHLKFYENSIYEILRNIGSSETKIKWVEIFCGEEFSTLHNNMYREFDPRELYQQYMKNYRSTSKLKTKSEELRTQIEILEAHIDFMPDGKGYQETKNNFENSLRIYK
jgi:hypothetical protein